MIQFLLIFFLPIMFTGCKARHGAADVKSNENGDLNPESGDFEDVSATGTRFECHPLRDDSGSQYELTGSYVPGPPFALSGVVLKLDDTERRVTCPEGSTECNRDHMLECAHGRQR